MNKDEVVSFIRTERDKHAKGFREITEDLKRKGYKSDKTAKPLTENTVRYIYHYGFKVLEKRDKTAAKDNVITFVKTILSTSTLSDKQKVEMISLYLKQHEQTGQ